ncbi:hypothetical protein [Archangium lipolyticum]|uniref:hypothetical protein n=1 Tax=Archangium lipolyticum TaxID=2970465 RepID=UPI00214A74C0|nr:hypothetical protein [Archangium lipolyticum]
MHAEAWPGRWAALLLGAVLFTTGCVTLATPTSVSFMEVDAQERLHLGWSARGPGWDEAALREVASGGTAPWAPLTCGGRAVPRGWPDFSSGAEALLAPFLSCTSPAEFVALQQRVDMPRLVASLDDWSAVRLGALGPVREDAAHLLQRKRAAFLLSATERYGLFHAEVFALFVLHSAYDDEVDEVSRLLAQDKQLGQTLALMPAVREELDARGLPLSDYPDRAERAADLRRGLGRAARDALSTSLGSDGSRYTELSARRAQLPPPYQQALHEVERALALRHFSAGNVAVGTFDAMTFGVPLGFYYLAAGTGQGAYSLSQGHYEQATRELTPALLLGTLYAGGKGLRALSEARGATGVGAHRLNGLQAMELRLRVLEGMARQLEAQLGVDRLRELARNIRARREVGRFVAVGGVDAVLALREARGNVARAQALMSKARPGATGSSAARRGADMGPGELTTGADDAARPALTRAGVTERAGGLASLVDEQAGLTREVVEARLALVEFESTGPRLPRNVAVLEKQRPSVEAPPPGAESNPRWPEYVAYYEKRLEQVRQGTAVKGPLRWAPYELMRGWFARGMAFERLMVELLRADAKLPRAERRFLGAFHKPRIERYVGVKKPGTNLHYADVLIIEEDELIGRPPRVETYSFKSRDLSSAEREALKAQMIEDASEALRKYGGTLDIRRDSLHPLLRGASEVPVSKVRLIYEGGQLNPKNVDALKEAVRETQKEVKGVEVFFQ